MAKKVELEKIIEAIAEGEESAIPAKLNRDLYIKSLSEDERLQVLDAANGAIVHLDWDQVNLVALDFITRFRSPKSLQPLLNLIGELYYEYKDPVALPFVIEALPFVCDGSEDIPIRLHRLAKNAPEQGLHTIVPDLVRVIGDFPDHLFSFVALRDLAGANGNNHEALGSIWETIKDVPRPALDRYLEYAKNHEFVDDDASFLLLLGLLDHGKHGAECVAAIFKDRARFFLEDFDDISCSLHQEAAALVDPDIRAA